MFAVLLLAAAAQADVPSAGGAPEGQEPGAGTTEPQQSGEGGWEGESQEAPQSTGEEAEVAETPSGETTGEAAGETVVETPVETQPLPPSEPAEAAPPPPAETVQEAPVATEGAESTPIALSEETGKSTESTEEGASGGAPTHTSSLLPPVGTSDPSVRAAGLEEPALTGPPATAATITAQIGEVSGQAKGSAKAIPMRSAGSQAGRFRCELSALGGKMTDNCTAGWLGAPREADSAPTSAAITAVSSLTAAAVDSPGGGGHGGSGLGGSPLTSAPGSAPGGSSGAATGAGGSGGSGTGVSIFITLAGLLLLGAPRALRRLQRAFEPWLAGCFVLIPERPD
jgi:hypothetical protein